ncbi:MAG TPA: class I SAM-dependent methyltransferase [Crinalium sp.]
MKDAYNPHGAALMDCFRGDTSAILICYQDGVRDDVPASFWLREAIDPLETLALELCRGHVLDVGAGAGLHSLELQRRGIEVTAIDVAPECVTIMRERGVRNAEVADLYEFEGGPFDTIACLCNGLDKVGRLTDLPRFLDRMRQLLAPGGQLIADSFDVRIGADESCLADLARKTEAGRYFGELDLRFEYKGQSGAPFSVLQVDYETLAQIAGQNGWHCDLIKRVGAHYLVRARPA